MFEVEVKGTPDDRRHRHAFCLGKDVDPPALLIGEVYLGAGR
jgi:hypothetical protein